MATRRLSGLVSWVLVATLALGLTGCENGDTQGDGGPGTDGKQAPPDIGDNHTNVYAALGDSITGGGNGGGAPYPPRLAALTGKTVINHGRDSESTSSALSRLGSILANDKPAAVLIDLGAIDLIESRGMDHAVENLRSIIQRCKANKSVPVISTMTPMSGSHRLWAGSAKTLSSRIRALAAEEGATLVDLEEKFGTGEGLLLGDGLHPNDAGNQLMAEAFRDQL